jgi:hypothetical protein
MKKVLVENGVVLGILVWDGVTPWEPNHGVQVIDVADDVEVHATWLYDGSVFTDPNPELVIPVVPQVGPNVVA